ncbi:hypothetical protein ABZX66_18375 [Micromonospora aurantiaca]|uniref:hypothetical protein n=1 Tax=Micromonospora aurantiaca (nom. illeg.) TaxID=47850 RepID=UPI0033B1531C
MFGSVTDLRGDDTVVINESSAEESGTAECPVVFSDGERVALRVVAVVTDASLPGGLLVPRAVARAHDSSALTSAIYTTERIELPADSGARVIDTATWAAEADGAEDRLAWLFTETTSPRPSWKATTSRTPGSSFGPLAPSVTTWSPRPDGTSSWTPH